MHPEIQEPEPGACPKCGMDLEPVSGAEEGDDESDEIRSLQRKTLVAGILTVPILALAFDSMIPGLSFDSLLSARAQGWLELFLATPVILWAGGMFFTRGWRSIVNRSLNMFPLIMLGVGAAYSQDDVRQLAELFAGMMVVLKDEGLTFQTSRGEPGPETVLGQSYGGAKPAMADVIAVLRDLARHPDTARHLARKLAVHFVADDPDPALVDALTARYLETDGALLAVYDVLLTHPAALAPPLSKAKQPFDFVASSLRALGVPGARLTGLNRVQVQRNLIRPMTRMGQPWEVPTGPDGWDEPDTAWITPQGLAARIEWAMALHDKLEDGLGLTPPDPRGLVTTALGPAAHQAVVFAAGAAETRAEGIGIVLVSPQFQRR